MTVKVTFWGVRGSTSCAAPEFMRYGGNTSCVEVDLGNETVIFDAGSGLRHLGASLLKRNVKKVSLFLSHFHWDHICGFPFFDLAYEKNAKINLYACPSVTNKTCEDVFNIQMSDPFFPATLRMIPSPPHFVNLSHGESYGLFDNQAKIKTIALNHPNGATGYRLDYNGKSIAYITDYEHHIPEKQQELEAFVNGADLLIYDAMYTPEQYEQFKGWGHSTWKEASLLAKRAEVKKTALFHHNPSNTDEMMEEIEQLATKENSSLFVAKEKLTIEL